MLKINKYKNNYYVSSFCWGTLAKIITAVVNFISVPLLLGIYGKNNYGILSLAQSANAYIAILDMGMNIGAVKFFSEWKVKGRRDLINKTARSNFTFYIIIGAINSLILICLAFFGRNIFNITDEQFILLRTCFFIIASFSIFNWVSTPFNQLLVANEQVSFVNEMQCITAALNVIAVILTVKFSLSLNFYFFLTVLIGSLLLIPYLIKVLKLKVLDSILPSWHWDAFKKPFLYSLNIFALSIFQMMASNSRPVILGIFSDEAANISSEYRIVTVFPNFIIMVSGIISTLLLPKSSKALANGNVAEKENIAYKGTFLTSTLANILCMPFVFCANEVICAYVGNEYSHLSLALIVWLFSVLYQIHSTPCNSLILATGKTRYIVISTAISCVLSMGLNIFLCNKLGVLSAVISYAIYVFLVITAYYTFYYRKILNLSGFKVFKSFFIPTVVALMTLFITSFIPFDTLFEGNAENRWLYVMKCLIKSFSWEIIYLGFMFVFYRRLSNGKK